jgi:ribosomal protein S18 acetylase RimI-like enzyme
LRPEAQEITVRPSRPEDLPYITALERHAENRELIGQWSDEEHLRAIAGSERWSHWIVENGGRPAGYVIARDCAAQGAGIYIKRVLVAEKERGTGKRALSILLERLFARDDVPFAWLIVRNENARAQAVYRTLGFERFEPEGDEARRLDAVAEAPLDRCLRLRLERGGELRPRSRDLP